MRTKVSMQVDPKDCDAYLKFTDIENIKSHFEQSDERMEISAGEVSKVIVPEEREAFVKKTKLSTIIDELRDKELLSYFQHVRRDDGSVACYRFNFCYEENDNSKIVLAIKDITERPTLLQRKDCYNVFINKNKT